MATTHESLKLLVTGNMVAIQPANAKGQQAETLSVDLATGRVMFNQAPLLGASAQKVLSVIGVFSLKAGAVLAVVTEAERVATLYGQPVFKATATRVIKPDVNFDSGDQRLLGYVSEALNPSNIGRNLCFAYHLDLTRTAQSLTAVLAEQQQQQGGRKGLAAGADKRFFWNRVLAQPLLDAGGDKFVLPMILGFVGQILGLQVPRSAGGQVTVTVSLIARRSADRAGTRHWRRGADFQGFAANFVETEQLVTLDDGKIVASYVQCRGSIPLLWSQIPNIKYKPPTRLLEGQASSEAFDAHFDALIEAYKGICCVNLVNQHGSEGLLEKAFAKEARRYGSNKSAALAYTAFDFHKECGATSYARLSVLLDKIRPEYEHYGQFMTGTPQEKRQDGVFRINCIDCLDRTNVVQGVLGRAVLQDLLVELGIISKGQTLAQTLPQLESRFKVLWADHGDAISQQYAGTGALKSGFTRTGKRTLGGLVDDGVKSVVRYYLNNFQDGLKQDALDLVSGAYRVKRDVKLHFQKQHSPVAPLLLALAAFVYALSNITHTAAIVSHRLADGLHNTAASAGFTLLRGVIAPLLLAASLLALVQKNGSQLVCKPQLCPQLANTVAHAELVKAKQVVAPSVKHRAGGLADVTGDTEVDIAK